MIPGITEHLPSYATLNQATVSFEEMGARVITTQVKIDGDIVPDFESTEWWIEYNGEKFTLNTHTPQATKDNTTRCSLIDLTFESFPVAELKRYFFIELSEVEEGTVIVDKYIASLRLNAQNFITAFNRVLDYYYDGLFEIQIESGTTLDPEVKEVTIEYTYLWDVLPAIYDVYGLIWRIAWDSLQEKYIIHVGGEIETIPNHIWQYGFSGGLTKIERQLQDADIYNQLLGRGGEQNLPYRYFKKADPNNTAFAADPDACAELENVYFERLLDINFRYYVKGWLRNPNRPSNPDYPVPSTPESAEIQAHWAYQKGLTDTKFQPVEYVQDDESVAEYGVRQGKLDDDDTIFPTIQGITVNPYGRIDEMVAIGTITDGDDGGASEEISLADMTSRQNFSAGSTLRYHTFNSAEFKVPSNRIGEIRYNWHISADESGMSSNYAYACSINTQYSEIVAVRTSDSAEFPITALPGGFSYRLRIKVAINAYPADKMTIRTVGLKNVRLIASYASDAGDNPMTFKVWVKNIWQTTQGANETDLEYMKRVWEPILGDRVGNEAKITFSDGWMSASSDYEFTIVDWPTVDRSKTLNGVASEWCLVLAKSDADFESTGKYLPNETSPKPVAGDHFFFTGIDMPHIYVLWAEKKLNETKQAALDAKAYANPTWAVQLDSVRINTLAQDETDTLMSQLGVGKVMEIYDPRFSGGEILQLAIRSMTITWANNTVMLPAVEVVLSENVLGRSVGSESLSPEQIIANVNNIVQKSQASTRAMMKTYLSREHEDTAVGKIKLAAGASYGDYAEGLAGMGANIDEFGHGELDSLTLRKWLEVPELRYNRVSVQIGNKWNAPGGGIIEAVYPDYDENGNMLNTGIIYLHLEDGEIGMVALDDICMGIFHDGINEETNALADTDDGIGNFHFSGFYTTYFRVTEILAEDNHCFRYAIRPVSTNWPETHHPCEQMHFVGYGNFSDTTRQTSRYSTRTYERYLKDVNSWEFTAQNIGAQFGDLSNLNVFGLNMSGYSAYLNNIYMSGVIKQFEELPYRIEIDTEGMDTLAYGETLHLSCTVYKGWEDVTDRVVQWEIVRDSGDAQADAAWLLLEKVRNFEGDIDIVHTVQYSDLATIGVSTLFTIRVLINDGEDAEFNLTI